MTAAGSQGQPGMPAPKRSSDLLRGLWRLRQRAPPAAANFCCMEALLPAEHSLMYTHCRGSWSPPKKRSSAPSLFLVMMK